MTLDSASIQSLTDFNLNSLDPIQRLKASGTPEVLTVDGIAEVVVQDAHAYQQLLSKAEFADTVKAIRAGMKAHKDGEGVPMRKALEQIAEEAGFSLDD